MCLQSGCNDHYDKPVGKAIEDGITWVVEAAFKAFVVLLVIATFPLWIVFYLIGSRLP